MNGLLVLYDIKQIYPWLTWCNRKKLIEKGTFSCICVGVVSSSADTVICLRWDLIVYLLIYKIVFCIILHKYVYDVNDYKQSLSNKCPPPTFYWEKITTCRFIFCLKYVILGL